MKVTQVAVCPSEASTRAGRPALTPELLAACGARYSRNNEGLDAILARIDPRNLETSVDAIFRMVDYGHQSIADMVPVAMFIDGISIWLAYYLWTLCPLAGGQESSTRYLKMSLAGLIPPEELGIPAAQRADWAGLMTRCFESYQTALSAWETLAKAHPGVMNIPRWLLEDAAPAALKKVARMRRNFAFDRARYYLPVACATNVMMVMSARAWVQLCQFLLSHPLPEPRALGERVRDELALSAPRLLKHAKASEAHGRILETEFDAVVQRARAHSLGREHLERTPDQAPAPFLSVLAAPGVSGADLARDLACHPNRYAPVGSGLQRTVVRFGWSAVGFAEIRDLNRHRTGTKFCPQVPVGFYSALDQAGPEAAGEVLAALRGQVRQGVDATVLSSQHLQAADPAHIYWSVLGAQYPFEHTTTADKFLYEAELRTGLGAHFRYARHLRDSLNLWYEQFPETKGLVLEGSGEPE